MIEHRSLPLFVREALEDASDPSAPDAHGVVQPAFDVEPTELVERTLLALEGALYEDSVAGGESEFAPAGTAFSRALQRLEHAVSEPPLRYAPFFGRAAELFDLSDDALVAELARLSEPGAWTFAGWPGVSHVTVNAGPRLAGAETLFVRFKPGVYFPRHAHTGPERVLVLEGSYADSLGVVHRPGELREWAPGTEHSFKVSAGETCIFASVVFGRRFSAWPLRALAALLGR